MIRRAAAYSFIVMVAAMVWACGGNTSTPTTPTPAPAPTPTPTPTPPPPPPPPPTLTAPRPEKPADGEQLNTLRPTFEVTNGTSDQAGTRTYEFQVSDRSDFSTAVASYFGGTYFVVVNKTGVPENESGKTSYAAEADLQPTTRLYWRVRMVQGETRSDWSGARSFKTKLVGFLRAGELYDPLIHGETVGVPVGSTTFIPGKGIRLNDGVSHVRYLLPQTVANGEFSMDVEGLMANAPGDKAKVFGMQEGQSDFITNPYRVDIQYRGTTGVPPNCIQWRVLYGSADDLSVRYEPDTEKRFNSVFNLMPTTTYHWKATWGNDFRLVVRAGGINGVVFYDYGLPTPRGRYTPSPHYAYLGAPVGRSGTESASIAGTIYSNVWLGNRPRPESLGSALAQ